MSRVHELGRLDRAALVGELIATMPGLVRWSNEKIIDIIVSAERGATYRREIQPPEAHAEKRSRDQGEPGMALVFRSHHDRLLFSQWLRGEGWTAFTGWAEGRL